MRWSCFWSDSMRRVFSRSGPKILSKRLQQFHYRHHVRWITYAKVVVAKSMRGRGKAKREATLKTGGGYLSLSLFLSLLPPKI